MACHSLSALLFSACRGPRRVIGLAVVGGAAAVGWAGDDEAYGVMTHFAQGWDPSLVPLVAAGGVRQVRDELYWNEVEAEKGVFKFPPAYDTYLNAMARHGITPLIVLSFENRHYDDGATPYTAEGCAGYARYAVEVLRHCGPRVKAVEIWNEYNGSFNHGPAGEDRAGTYLKMLRVAYAAIKQERPDVTVVAGATAGVPLPYWEKLFAGGVLNWADALSIHPYRYEAPPEGIEDDIAGLRRLASRYGAVKPIWVTEIGWQLKPSKAAGDLVIDEEVQARFLARSFALLQSAGVERTYWYLFRDTPEFSMGLVHDDAERTPKPAYQALATLVRELRGLHFLRREPAAAGLYSLVFGDAAGREKRMLWSLTPRRLGLAGAVAAVGLTGQALDLEAGTLLDDAPIYVAGPLPGLPPPEAAVKVLADSARDFSDRQDGAWNYGTLAADSGEFIPLPRFERSDWTAGWVGDFSYGTVTATDQHPSARDGRPVAFVRRWRSAHEGRVRITGEFRCGTNGDGVGVSVRVGGRPLFRELLGGGAPVVRSLDLTLDVHAGTTVDFVVDPGPATNIDFDATAVAIVIRAEP